MSTDVLKLVEHLRDAVGIVDGPRVFRVKLFDEQIFKYLASVEKEV